MTRWIGDSSSKAYPSSTNSICFYRAQFFLSSSVCLVFYRARFGSYSVGFIFVSLHLCPLIADMSSDVMWYSGQSYPAIYRATRGLGLVKRLRCSYVFKQKYSFKGVGISGKFDQYFPVTDLRKTCCSHDHCEPDHWPLILLSLKFYRSFVNAEWSHRRYNLNVEEQFAARE